MVLSDCREECVVIREPELNRWPLPTREKIEEMVRAAFSPTADIHASAAYKRYVAAVLVGGKLAAYGPREIVLTQSSGVTVYAEGKISQAPFTPRNLSGRTGRGDTCFGTYVAKRLSLTPEEACRWAGAVTTLKQEHPGPWRGSPADVEALLRSQS